MGIRELAQVAKSLEIPGAVTMKKQELVFQILRAQAEKELEELRKQREALIKKLEGVEITIQRSCNDLGHLYASVTQQEIAKALAEAGHTGVRARDVRLHQNIKRVDTYDVHMTDILAGRIRLGRFHGMVACGGFSYGDVLGAGEGWAKSILFNARARVAERCSPSVVLTNATSTKTAMESSSITSRSSRSSE